MSCWCSAMERNGFYCRFRRRFRCVLSYKPFLTRLLTAFVHRKRSAWRAIRSELKWKMALYSRQQIFWDVRMLVRSRSLRQRGQVCLQYYQKYS